MEMNATKPFVFCVLLAGCSTSARKHEASPPSPEPIATVLSEAGNCTGHTCTMHFAIDARGDSSTFTQARCRAATCPMRRGQLTADAENKVQELSKELVQLKLEPVYGSPGSADGPVYVAIVHRPDGTESRHHLDPLEPDALPPPLRQASELMGAVSDALDRCESTPLFQPASDCAQAEREDGDPPVARP